LFSSPIRQTSERACGRRRDLLALVRDARVVDRDDADVVDPLAAARLKLLERDRCGTLRGSEKPSLEWRNGQR
jgi:hypothetical protein